MESKNENLLEEFSPLTRADWEKKIAEDSGEEALSKKLFSEMPDHIQVKPFYCAEDVSGLEDFLPSLPGEYPFTRGGNKSGNNWEIRQDIRVDDVSEANKRALYLIEKGVHAVGFFKGDIPNPDFEEIQQLLHNMDLQKMIVHWMSFDDPACLADHLIRTAEVRQLDPSCLKGSVCVDPIGEWTRTGSWCGSFTEEMQSGMQLFNEVKELPGIKTIEINGLYFADAGGSGIQELTYSLALAAEYLTYYSDQGIPVKEIVSRMQLNLGTGENYFFEIAKLRAARMLWANLVKAYDEKAAKEIPAYVQSITTCRNKTAYDSYVNILRLTTEAMAAILGGCDSLVVHPFDTCLKEPNDFSQRVARNIQIILREEAYFDKVIDPAGGAYFIESLTDSIYLHAWQQFLVTEQHGGYIEMFKKGLIQKEIRDHASQVHEKTARGKQTLLGTNSFPNDQESIHATADPDLLFSQNTVTGKEDTEPLRPLRASVAFEKLRLAVEKHPGKRPKVFMLKYGNKTMRRARSQFSSNFFAVAGYEITDNYESDQLSDGVSAALLAQADVVVACSSDDEYAAMVPQVFDLLQGKAILVVAGKPPCMEDLQKKGIEHFVYAGANMIDMLAHFHKLLGIKQEGL